MARLGGFEPSTTRLEGVCSIHTELQVHYLHYRLFINFKELTVYKLKYYYSKRYNNLYGYFKYFILIYTILDLGIINNFNNYYDSTSS